MTTPDERKRRAAEAAVERFVRPGMLLGLGTGSTAAHVVRSVAERLHDGRLSDIAGVATSKGTARLARELGVHLTTLAHHPRLDVAIDGADEIDPALDLIKGAGGAHLREKVVACSAERFVVVADDGKLVPRLGATAALPVEVIPFARPLCARLLADAGWSAELRAREGGSFVTDEGNAVFDCRRGDWSDPAALAARLEAMTGVVEHGFFLGVASAAVIGGADGRVRVLERGPG